MGVVRLPGTMTIARRATTIGNMMTAPRRQGTTTAAATMGVVRRRGTTTTDRRGTRTGLRLATTGVEAAATARARVDVTKAVA